MSLGGQNSLLSVNYEVYGRVQGVFFRKHTEKEAKRLSLRGWVKNTSRGTVQGQLQGSEENVHIMQAWLRHTGSPSSKIEKAQFSDERRIPQFEYSDFRIVK